MHNQSKAYFFAALTILSWSTVATAFKFGLKYQEPSQLLTIAAVVATLVLGAGVVIQGKTREIFTGKKRDYLYSALLGLLNPFLYYLILFRAYDILPAQVAQPINMIWPIVLVVISAPMLGQTLKFYSMAGLIISFAGVVLISSQGGGKGFEPAQIPGIILCLISSLIWSFYWILNVKDKRDETVKIFLNFIFSLVWLLLYNMIKGNSLPVNPQAWFWASYAGIFEMGIAFIFWLKALSYSESTDKVSNLIYISPFISLLFIHYFVGEPVYGTTIGGLFLIIAGIAVQNRVWKKKN